MATKDAQRKAAALESKLLARYGASFEELWVSAEGYSIVVTVKFAHEQESWTSDYGDRLPAAQLFEEASEELHQLISTDLARRLGGSK